MQRLWQQQISRMRIACSEKIKESLEFSFTDHYFDLELPLLSYF